MSDEVSIGIKIEKSRGYIEIVEWKEGAGSGCAMILYNVASRG